MKKFSKKEVLKKDYANPAYPFLSELKISFMRFVAVSLGTDFITDKSSIFNSVFIVALSILAIFFGAWRPITIFLLILFVIYIRWIWNLRGLYKLYKENYNYWIDQYGISSNISNGVNNVRFESYGWKYVKNIFQLKDLIVVIVEGTDGLPREVVLQPKNMERDLKSILSYWYIYLNNLPIEEMPIHYLEEEYNDVENYIEQNFGEIYRIGEVDSLSVFDVDLAVIKPTLEKPYYTLCTIGLGAHRIENEQDTRLNACVSDYCELVLYLPQDWNVVDEGCEQPENFWPIRLIQEMVKKIIIEKLDFKDGDYTDLDDAYRIKFGVKSIIIDNVLPNITKHSFVNTSIGRSVQFYQLIPIDVHQYDLVGTVASYEDYFVTLFGLEYDENITEEGELKLSKEVLSKTLQLFSSVRNITEKSE